MEPHIGIIGLGIMGGAMADALVSAGYRVCGYDVNPGQRERLKRTGGRPLSSCAAVASSVEVIITSLPSVAAFDDVVGKIALACETKRRSDSRLIVIETSTLPIADKKRALRRLKPAGITVLDCPISGTAQRMKEGAWTMFVSGDPDACKKINPIFEVFTRNAPYVGVFGNGSKMKFIANHLVAIYNVAVAESLTFARTMSLDPHQVWRLFATSPVVGTGVFKLRGKFMVERKYVPPTMKIEVWQKDMHVIGDMASSLDCPLPIFTACIPLYNAAMAQGLGQSDTASVCEVLYGMAGGHRRRGRGIGKATPRLRGAATKE